MQVSERMRRQQRELEAAAYNQRQVRQPQRKATETNHTWLSVTSDSPALGVAGDNAVGKEGGPCMHVWHSCCVRGSLQSSRGGKPEKAKHVAVCVCFCGALLLGLQVLLAQERRLSGLRTELTRKAESAEQTLSAKARLVEEKLSAAAGADAGAGAVAVAAAAGPWSGFATLPVPRNRTPQPSRVQQQCLFVCLFGCILLTPQARWLSVQAGCHSCGTAGRVRMHARTHACMGVSERVRRATSCLLVGVPPCACSS